MNVLKTKLLNIVVSTTINLVGVYAFSEVKMAIKCHLNYFQE